MAAYLDMTTLKQDCMKKMVKPVKFIMKDES